MSATSYTYPSLAALALAALAVLSLALAAPAQAACTSTAKTRYTVTFTVSMKPSSFGGSVTDFEVYLTSPVEGWVKADSYTVDGYNVTGNFTLEVYSAAVSITITKVGINHNNAGYSDPTQVTVWYNGTEVYSASISSHTWQSGTSYFEYVAIDASFNAAGAAAGNYTEYDCSLDEAGLRGEAAPSLASQLAAAEGIAAAPTLGGSYQAAQTVTETQTVTRYYTVTKTVTGGNGEITTVVETVPAPPSATVPGQQGPSRRAVLAGAGVLAFLFLLLLAAKR